MTSKMTSAGIVITQGDTLNIPLHFSYSQEGKKIPVGTYYTDIEIQFIDGQKFTFYPPNPNCKAFFKVVAQYTKGN